jgi:hypothetical protein
MHQEDAIRVILESIDKPRSPTGRPTYGYDIYIPNLLRELTDNDEREAQELSPVFFDAAWELCRRGILRPGIRAMREQATQEGGSGAGFSVTPFGRKWIQEPDRDLYVPTEPERFAEMMEPLSRRFGPGFHERSQEAVRAYGAHAYLACCVMCGAAAESVLLATAIAKKQDEESVLRMYRTANGRRQVENLVIGKAIEQLQRELRGLTPLLKYWRDEAAHGTPSKISENEAYTSLAMLLRYAMFIDKNWKALST